MQTLDQFLKVSDVVMQCEETAVDGDPTFPISEPWAAHRYSCELRRSNRHRPVRAIVGSNHGVPDLLEVLDAVAAEAAVVDEARGYEQWALRMGFDPDSREGERIYRAARRQARMLRELLGDDSYAQLLWETERV